jgi:hypothetical protein
MRIYMLTATPGLSVHMNQVHKENLTHVENANSGRQGLEIEIFGMEGVPAEIIDQHNQQVTQAHFAEEAERARITGNPIRGEYTNGTAPPNKRAKVTETLEEIEKRAEKFRTDRKNGVLPLPPAVQEVVTNPVRIHCECKSRARLRWNRHHQPFNHPTAHPQPLFPHPRMLPPNLPFLIPTAAYPASPALCLHDQVSLLRLERCLSTIPTMRYKGHLTLSLRASQWRLRPLPHLHLQHRRKIRRQRRTKTCG